MQILTYCGLLAGSWADPGLQSLLLLSSSMALCYKSPVQGESKFQIWGTVSVGFITLLYSLEAEKFKVICAFLATIFPLVLLGRGWLIGMTLLASSYYFDNWLVLGEVENEGHVQHLSPKSDFCFYKVLSFLLLDFEHFKIHSPLFPTVNKFREKIQHKIFMFRSSSRRFASSKRAKMA